MRKITFLKAAAKGNSDCLIELLQHGALTYYKFVPNFTIFSQLFFKKKNEKSNIELAGFCGI